MRFSWFRNIENTEWDGTDKGLFKCFCFFWLRFPLVFPIQDFVRDLFGEKYEKNPK